MLVAGVDIGGSDLVRTTFMHPYFSQYAKLLMYFSFHNLEL